MSGYEEDRAWSDRYLPKVKALVGRAIFSAAPFVEDTQHATDLIVLSADRLRIAVRLRRAGPYLTKYGDQFTIRWKRRGGVSTEAEKIIRQGFGDYLFYGFGAGDGSIPRWTIGDLDVFRSWYKRTATWGRIPGQEIDNRDGTIGRAFRWSQVVGANGEDLVVASNVTFEAEDQLLAATWSAA